MYNVCMRMVNHIGEAEDILQESFLEAFTKLSEFRGDASFGSWLKRIVINRSINYLRKRKLELMESVEDADLVEEENDNEEEVQLEVLKVQKAIQELPDGYRVVLSMYLLEGYDHSEIAEVLNITESTSKSQFNRAKNKLREILKEISYAKQN
jgi:RNA polymerase sigma factor (sigma-70 family)